MEDARVPARLGELKRMLQEELDELERIDENTWTTLAFHTTLSAGELRHRVLQAIRTSAAYVHKKSFTLASTLPYSLLQGDLMNNLSVFGENPCPIQFGPAAQLHRLYKAGFDKDSLKQALYLMSTCPWSTILVEQIHASCAFLVALKHLK
eukprot:3446752-Amphidinium_carterae.1